MTFPQRLAATYAHVETRKKALRSSLDLQEQRCVALAERYGFEVAPCYRFRQVSSGRSMIPPTLQLVLALACAGGLQALFCEDIDRLARSATQYLVLTQTFKLCGTSLYFVESEQGGHTFTYLQAMDSLCMAARQKAMLKIPTCA